MSYQVIARKYRPQRFSDVVGQEHVTRTLSQAIEQQRIAHAYLFCGPRGTGKTTIARIFAKCLNCTGGPKVDFDDADPRCEEISQGRSMDVLEIDGASNNGVEQVRELRETCRYAPASSKFKIYIIDEVHMLSAAAFNALLKTLEEPPDHVKFMFATTDPEKVLPTILSRCQRFDLRRIPTALISKHLALIADQEGVKVEPPALHAIARGADGGMRDAESTLDQLISFCGKNIEEGDVLSMFGLAGQRQLLALSEAILSGNIETALRELNELATKGKDLGRLMADLLNHFRNLLIYLVGSGDLSMLEVSEAEAGALAQQAAMVGTSARQAATPPKKGAPMPGADIVGRILDSLAETDLKMRNAASRKIILEVGILKAIEARNSISLDAVLTQLRALREEGGGGAPLAPTGSAPRERATAKPAGAQMSASPDPSPAMALSETPPAAQPSVAPVSQPSAHPDMDGLWALLLSAANPMVRPALERAQPVSFANRVFSIGFHPDDEAQIAFVDTPRNLAQFQTKLKEAGWENVQLKFAKLKPDAARGAAPVAAASPTPPAAVQQKPAEKPAGGATARKAELPPVPGKERQAAAPVFDKEQFKNDPLIKKALEDFKGQIVEVRS